LPCGSPPGDRTDSDRRIRLRGGTDPLTSGGSVMRRELIQPDSRPRVTVCLRPSGAGQVVAKSRGAAVSRMSGDDLVVRSSNVGGRQHKECCLGESGPSQPVPPTNLSPGEADTGRDKSAPTLRYGGTAIPTEAALNGAIPLALCHWNLRITLRYALRVRPPKSRVPSAPPTEAGFLEMTDRPHFAG
jgi:hypothetical protein